MTGLSKRRNILILGEGDFSFSLHLLQSPSTPSVCQNTITATSFDTRDEIQEKFGADGLRIVDQVKSLGGRILHRIDATRLELYQELADQDYDEIIFHHPHCGVEDARRHRILLAHIFRSASKLLSVPNGTVTISLASGQAERWAIVDQAALSSLILLKAELLTASFNWRRHQGRSFQLIHRGNNPILQSSISFTFGQQNGSNQAIEWNPSSFLTSSESLPSFPCDLCEKSYRTAQGLRTHFRAAHTSVISEPPSKARCQQCQRDFIDDSALKMHMLAKHGGDPVIKPDWFDPNQDTYKGPALVSCGICRESFSSIDLFWDHEKKLQPSAPLSLSCRHCEKVFKSRHSLRQHLLHCPISSIVTKDDRQSVT